MSSRFSSMLSSRSFIVLHFTFRSMIHFQLIFVKSVRSMSRSVLLHIDVQLFQHHLLKRLSFLHCIAFSLCQLTIFVWVYFWALYSVLLIYLSNLSTIPHCYSFTVRFEVRCVNPPTLFFSKYCLNIVSSVSPYKF